LYFNARSLHPKLDELIILTEDRRNPDVICITETWLSGNVYDQEIIPLGYNIYCNDQPSRGGGVMISIKESISTSVISSPDHIEAITVKLSTCNQIILSCIYIPPNSSTSQIHDVERVNWTHQLDQMNVHA